MSSLVVKKEAWDRGCGYEPFMKSCWGHVARIFSLIPSGLTVKLLDGSYLFKRSDNDSFMNKGIVHRLVIAIDYFQEIADHFFGGTSQESFHVRRTIRNEMSNTLLCKI